MAARPRSQFGFSHRLSLRRAAGRCRRACSPASARIWSVCSPNRHPRPSTVGDRDRWASEVSLGWTPSSGMLHLGDQSRRPPVAVLALVEQQRLEWLQCHLYATDTLCCEHGSPTQAASRPAKTSANSAASTSSWRAREAASEKRASEESFLPHNTTLSPTRPANRRHSRSLGSSQKHPSAGRPGTTGSRPTARRAANRLSAWAVGPRSPRSLRRARGPWKSAWTSPMSCLSPARPPGGPSVDASSGAEQAREHGAAHYHGRAPVSVAAHLGSHAEAERGFFDALEVELAGSSHRRDPRCAIRLRRLRRWWGRRPVYVRTGRLRRNRAS